MTLLQPIAAIPSALELISDIPFVHLQLSITWFQVCSCETPWTSKRTSLQNYKVKACTSRCSWRLIFALMRSNEGFPHQLVFAQHVSVSVLLLWNGETRRLTYPRAKLCTHIGQSNKIHDTQIADGNNPVVAWCGLFFRLFSQKHQVSFIWGSGALLSSQT